MLSVGLGLLHSNLLRMRRALNKSSDYANIITLIRIKKAIASSLPYDDLLDLDDRGSSAFVIDWADYHACMAYLLNGTTPPKYGGESNA